MTNNHIQKLIQQFDEGDRSPKLAHKVFATIEIFAKIGKFSPNGIADGEDNSGEESLRNGVEWLRRKQNAHHLNEA